MIFTVSHLKRRVKISKRRKALKRNVTGLLHSSKPSHFESFLGRNFKGIFINTYHWLHNDDDLILSHTRK
jgi:hypothetical protein